MLCRHSRGDSSGNDLWVIQMRKVRPEDEIPLWVLEPDAIEAKLHYFNHKRTEDPDTGRCQRELVDYVQKLNNRPVDTRKWVAFAHTIADRYMEPFRDYIVCRKGCAHCCHLPVGVPFLEAEYIAARSGRALNPRAKETFDIVPGPDNTTPCPFLNTDEGICSIYAFRPLACRMFATVDSYRYCEDINTSHHIVTTEASDAISYSTAAMIAAVKQNSRGRRAAFSELRDWFPEKTLTPKK